MDFSPSKLDGMPMSELEKLSRGHGTEVPHKKDKDRRGTMVSALKAIYKLTKSPEKPPQNPAKRGRQEGNDGEAPAAGAGASVAP